MGGVDTELFVDAAGSRDAAMTTERAVAGRRFDTIAICGSYDHAEAEKNNDSICEPAYLTSAQHFSSAEAMRATLAGGRGAPGVTPPRQPPPPGLRGSPPGVG